MLKTMRQHAKYFYVLFVIVIITFIFWGVGGVDNESPNLVAEVGKYKISSYEFWREYDKSFNIYRDIYKEKFDEEMQEKLKLKETTLDSLIDNKVLLISAADAGITVSDQELNDVITTDPAFMRDGVFDIDVYQKRLEFSRMTREVFESSTRQALMIFKMKRLIELSVNIPETDLNAISADVETMKAIREAIINDSKSKAIKAYVNGLKKRMDIKVYPDMIS